MKKITKPQLDVLLFLYFKPLSCKLIIREMEALSKKGPYSYYQVQDVVKCYDTKKGNNKQDFYQKLKKYTE